MQLWLVAEKGLDPARAQTLYGLMFVAVGLAGTFGAGLLGDWAQRRLGWDHARTAFLILLVLGPLLPLYRLSEGDSVAFLIGMVGSILFMTVLYGLVFAVIEELLPQRLKATSTGLNMLLINVFAIGAVSLLIGFASDRLAAAGSAHSWTWPLTGADALALLAIPCTFLAMRRGHGNPHLFGPIIRQKSKSEIPNSHEPRTKASSRAPNLTSETGHSFSRVARSTNDRS